MLHTLGVLLAVWCAWQIIKDATKDEPQQHPEWEVREDE